MQVKKHDLAMDAQYLKGVGPKRAETLRRLGIYTVTDMLYYLPRRYEDRTDIVAIKDVKPGNPHTVKGVIRRHNVWKTKKGALVYEMTVNDDSGSIHALWFNQPYMKNHFRPGQSIIMYGKVERFKYLQITQPDYEIIADDDPEEETAHPPAPRQKFAEYKLRRIPPLPAEKNRSMDESAGLHMGRIVPVYPLTQDITQRYLRALIDRTLQSYAGLLADPLPTDLRARNRLADTRFAVWNIHFPENFDNLRMAHRRLVFEEFFFLEVALAMAKLKRKSGTPGISHAVDVGSIGSFEKLLPFEITVDQRETMRQIEEDMASPRPMNRLLEGEVGSGKTVVAMYALLLTVRNGFRGVMMVPTEILAQQHYITLGSFFMPLGVKVGLLTGGMSKEARDEARRALVSGEADIMIGTHALIQESVGMEKVGLVVVDEQHKFGVSQRKVMHAKSGTADCLMMTATPIPRTLALTVYGDLDISVIRQLPGDRKPISTYWVEEERGEKVYAFVREELRRGRQCYVVAPRIEEKDGEIASAKALHSRLAEEAFPDFKAALIHGRLKPAEKEKIMRDFKRGKVNILVSTVLVEVGIDVPNASVMVIENADRFGLAQLHQLRGRIGRGEHESYCILLSDPRNEQARRRLNAFQSMQDGFELAEEDLSIRGQGQLLGTRQHGLPELKFGDIVADRDVLEVARSEAFRVVEADPHLSAERNCTIREQIIERFKGRTSFLGIG